MKLDGAARRLIGSDPATLVTVNRDGSPQISLGWMVLQSTASATMSWSPPICRSIRRSATSGVIPGWR
jgi:hypothetical protein